MKGTIFVAGHKVAEIMIPTSIEMPRIIFLISCALHPLVRGAMIFARALRLSVLAAMLPARTLLQLVRAGMLPVHTY
jgi:hypothetical protein